MPELDHPSEGLFGSIRRFFHDLLGWVQNRVELFAVEFQQEKFCASQLALRIGGVIIFGFLTVILASFTLVVAFWDQRVAILIALTAVYAIATAGFFLSLRAKLKNARLPFSSTLAEFKKDKECWEQKH